jgi:hypothetical protein
MRKPDPELLDDENPEWTADDFARAVSFSALPTELQAALSTPPVVRPEADPEESRQPAA